jgi:hypothetical protein
MSGAGEAVVANRHRVESLNQSMHCVERIGHLNAPPFRNAKTHEAEEEG